MSVENILELVASDAYLQLWLTARKAKGKTRTKDQWQPALVKQFDDPKDVPDFIIVTDETIHTDSNGRFHFGDSSEPTVSAKSMIIMWGTQKGDSGDEDEIELHREEGPARVELTGLKKWHSEGLIHRRKRDGKSDALVCTQATFTWAKRGLYMRPDGPYHISIRGIQAEGNMGSIKNIRLSTLVPSWATENRRKLNQTEVRDLIKRYNLKVNLLAFGNVFENPEDELIFLTEMDNAKSHD